VDNVTFVQANAENLDYADASFDYVQSVMFLHETSYKAIHRIMDEIHRVLTPGGLTLHVEQPQYTDDMDLYEQFIRDWDARYNNEPFWSTLHDMDMEALLTGAGFDEENLLQLGVRAVTDDEDPTDLPENGEEPEDHGREAVWNVFGAWK
jgi:ubiquinone/menaquinone biosynthesis C-methylase UbiE